MKTQVTISMAIVATYIMSATVHAAQTTPPPPFEFEQPTDDAKAHVGPRAKLAQKSTKAPDGSAGKGEAAGKPIPAADTVKPAAHTTTETPKAEVKPAAHATEAPKGEEKPAAHAGETAKAEVKPAAHTTEAPKAEVKPAAHSTEAAKPEVKPAVAAQVVPPANKPHLNLPHTPPPTRTGPPKFDQRAAIVHFNAFAKFAKANPQSMNPHDVVLHKWLLAHRGPDGRFPWDNEQFRIEFAFQWDLRQRECARESYVDYVVVPGEPVILADGVIPPGSVADMEAAEEQQEQLAAADAVADTETDAGFGKCNAECLRKLNETRDQLKAALAEKDEQARKAAEAQARADENARRAAQAQADADAARRSRPSHRGDDDDEFADGDREFGRGGRPGSRYGRDSYGRDPYGRTGYNHPFNNYGYPQSNMYNDPFSLGNPAMFGPNGMSNPYPYWMNQNNLGNQMLMNQAQYNPWGLNQGRMLPQMYPAPGGMQQPFPYSNAPFSGGAPMYAGQPFMGGRPMMGGAPMFGGGAPMYAGSPIYGGGAPMYAGQPFMGGARPAVGAPMYAGPAYGGGAGIGGGGYRPIGGGAPATAPYIGGGYGGGGYGGYGLGANCGGWTQPGYQYRSSLPQVYPAPYTARYY